MVVLKGDDRLTIFSQAWIFPHWEHPLFLKVDQACNYVYTKAKNRQKSEVSEDLTEIIKASDLTSIQFHNDDPSAPVLIGTHNHIPALWTLLIPQETQSVALWISKIKHQIKLLKLSSVKIFLPDNALLTELQSLLTTDDTLTEIYIVQWPDKSES